MAKGLRASSRKKNNTILRDRLFGPASDARTERLSAKLQELAAKSRPDQERAMDVDIPEKSKEPAAVEDEDMAINAQDVKSKSAKRRSKPVRPARVGKKVAHRKPRNSMVFADVKAKWRRQTAPKRKI